MNRSRDQEGLDAHVHETRDGLRRAIGVQRGQHEVAGKCRLDGDFRGFKVANFAHQDNVGVLAQEGAQGRRKIQADLLLHLHLVHASQLEFNRVFGGHDVGIGLVQPRDGRVERVGFARSGRPGDQHHAVGLQNGLLELDQRLLLETELGHIQAEVFLVQQPEHDLLAPQRGQSGDAEIELLFLAADLHLQHDAAVLRQPLFADVELGHDLEPRSDGVLQFQRRIHDQLQNSVNAEADAEFLFVGLHVNVAGAALHRIGEHQVHQLDDGSFVGRLLQFPEFEFLLLVLHLNIGAFAGVVHRLHDLLELFFFGSPVGLIDALDDRAFRGHDRFDVKAGHELDIVHGKDVGGIHHGDGERSADAAERQNLIAFRGFEGNQLDHGGVDFKIRKIDGGHAVLAREKVGDILIREETQLHQRRGKPGVRLLLELGRLFQLLWGYDLFFDEQVTQPLRHISPVFPPSPSQCEAADFRGDQRRYFRTDTNCQPNGNSAKVTSVPVLRGTYRLCPLLTEFVPESRPMRRTATRQTMFFGAGVTTFTTGAQGHTGRIYLFDSWVEKNFPVYPCAPCG